MEPAVADGRRRRIGIFPVAGHDVLAPDDDFTLLAARQLSPLFVKDFQVERFENLARRSELVPVVLGRIGRNDGCSFRKSVSLEHRDPDGIEKALQLRIEQCAAPDEKLQAAAECLPHLAEQHEVEKSHDGCQQDPPALALVVAVLIVDIGRAEREVEQPFSERSFGPNRSFDVFAEIFGQRRHRQQEVGFHFADILRNILERLHRGRPYLYGRHAGAAGDHDVESHHVRETVVQRQDDERAVAGRDVDARERLFDVGRVVAVGQDDAFRIGRRARRVGDRGVVVVPDCLPYFEKFLLMPGQIVAAQTFEHAVGRFAAFERNVSQDDDLFEFRQFRPDAADLRKLLFRNEQRLDLGVAEPEQQIVRLFEFDRQRNADRSGIEDTQLGDDPAVASFGQDSDLVFGADAQRS